MEVAVKTLNLLEAFHDEGYVHCDLKPENIMIGDMSKGRHELRKLYLIDFGLSHRYLDRNNKHVANVKNTPFKGSCCYASKYAFSNQF